MAARPELGSRPWSFRRRTEGRGRCAGEWVKLWWWNGGGRELGLTEFKRRRPAAEAVMATTESFSSSRGWLGGAQGKRWG
jgi:hypothetical protein